MAEQHYAALTALAACYRTISAASVPANAWDGASMLLGMRAGLGLAASFPAIATALLEEYLAATGNYDTDIAALARMSEALLRGMPPAYAMGMAVGE